MPAKRLFALGVGHVRRRGMPPGSRADQPAEAMEVAIADLNELEWRVMNAVKREFEPEEIIEDIWTVRLLNVLSDKHAPRLLGVITKSLVRRAL